MHVLIAGGTGFIGTKLTSKLLHDGHSVTLLTRDAASARDRFASDVGLATWDGRRAGAWTTEVAKADAVVNLSGAGIGDGRWTEARKKVLLDSRVDATRAIVEAIGMSSQRPSVLVNASAVGFYGNVPDGDATEDAGPGDDTLARICVAWENEARKAEAHGIRVIMPRSGVVLDALQGAFPRMALPFKLFAGGPLGSGRQWFPWVHLEDEVGAIMHMLENRSLSGPVNITGPDQVRMKEFGRTLARVLRRPFWAPAPGFVLKIVLGEMAGPLLLSGQRAVPDKLQRSGYVFSFPNVEAALRDVVG